MSRNQEMREECTLQLVRAYWKFML